MLPRCETCKFYCSDNTCHRRAPVPFMFEEHGEFKSISWFPDVTGYNYCGEHESIPKGEHYANTPGM